MKGDVLPDSDHVSRLCRPRTIVGGEITGAAFLLRPEEPYLSVNWLEFLKANGRKAELAEIRRCIRLTLGATARLAVLNVGRSRKYVRENSPDNRDLLFAHEPKTDPGAEDESHSGIFNTRSEDDLIAELLVETVEDHYPARS